MVEASVSVINNRISNPDFENGNVDWTATGSWAGIESCCGQHDTPYWGMSGRPDIDTWDGGLEPVNQFTRLYQYSTVFSSGTWRLSTWAATNGMTAYVRAYWTDGRNVTCGSTNSSTQTPISCEFSATLNESVASVLEGSGVTSQWAVSDDWALTPISSVPASAIHPKFSSIPVNYYTNGYAMRTEMAGWSWNNAVGKQLLNKVSDINQAKITFDVHNYGATDWWGRTYTPVNGIVRIEINTNEIDAWPLYPYGLEMRQSVMAHEFGHALGLDDIITNCQLMNTVGRAVAWYCNAYSPTSGDANGMRALYP